VSEVMGAVVALVVTLGAAPLVARALSRTGTLDVPNHRSSHTVPVPRGGGLACAAGIAAGAAVAAALGDEVPWAALAAAAVLGVVGLVDDRRTMPALPRLVAQLVVGAALGWATVGGPLGAVVGAALVALLVNVVNFMDGINGITGLTVAVVGATAWWAGAAHGSPALAVLGALAVGSAAGFLPWNAVRARLFLGDVGSYLFGALVAGTVLVGAADDVPLGLLLAPTAVYVADVLVALAKRAWRRARLTEAHREHVYQRLVDDGGLPHLAVAAVVAGAAAVLAAAWGLTSAPVAAAVSVVVLAAYLLAPAWALPSLRRRKEAAA